MTRVEFKTWLPHRLLLSRQLAGITQKQLAEQTGLTQDWISHFECGRRSPDAYSFFRLQQALRFQLPENLNNQNL